MIRAGANDGVGMLGNIRVAERSKADRIEARSFVRNGRLMSRAKVSWPPSPGDVMSLPPSRRNRRGAGPSKACREAGEMSSPDLGDSRDRGSRVIRRTCGSSGRSAWCGCDTAYRAIHPKVLKGWVAVHRHDQVSLAKQRAQDVDDAVGSFKSQTVYVRAAHAHGGSAQRQDARVRG